MDTRSKSAFGAHVPKHPIVSASVAPSVPASAGQVSGSGGKPLARHSANSSGAPTPQTQTGLKLASSFHPAPQARTRNGRTAAGVRIGHRRITRTRDCTQPPFKTNLKKRLPSLVRPGIQYHRVCRWGKRQTSPSCKFPSTISTRFFPDATPSAHRSSGDQPSPRHPSKNRHARVIFSRRSAFSTHLPIESSALQTYPSRGPTSPPPPRKNRPRFRFLRTKPLLNTLNRAGGNRTHLGR